MSLPKLLLLKHSCIYAKRGGVAAYHIVWITDPDNMFWVIPRRLNCMCRRFGTLFHFHRWCKQAEIEKHFYRFSKLGAPTV
jgi:hypothetical protein